MTPYRYRNRVVFCIVVFIVLCSLCGGEIISRAYMKINPASPEAYMARLLTTDHGRKPGDPHDGLLGWRNVLPQRGHSAPPAIVCFGDSFTWGDEVASGEDWPAILGRKMGFVTLNMGVCGYGMDQITLATLKYLRKHPAPDLVIVAIIADDVARCETTRRRPDLSKPHYTFDNDRMRLHIPHRSLAIEASGRVLSWLGGRSAMAAIVRSRTSVAKKQPRSGASGERIAERLLDKLGTVGSPIMFVFLPTPRVTSNDRDLSARLCARANSAGMHAVNLVPEWDLFIEDKPNARNDYFKVCHMNVSGNEWVASMLSLAVLPFLGSGGPSAHGRSVDNNK